MPCVSSRRNFIKLAGLTIATVNAAPWWSVADAAENAIADTATGKIRGMVLEKITVFKGIPYGAPTSGRNRFMAPPEEAECHLCLRNKSLPLSQEGHKNLQTLDLSSDLHLPFSDPISCGFFVGAQEQPDARIGGLVECRVFHSSNATT